MSEFGTPDQERKKALKHAFNAALSRIKEAGIEPDLWKEMEFMNAGLLAVSTRESARARTALGNPNPTGCESDEEVLRIWRRWDDCEICFLANSLLEKDDISFAYTLALYKSELLKQRIGDVPISKAQVERARKRKGKKNRGTTTIHTVIESLKDPNYRSVSRALQDEERVQEVCLENDEVPPKFSMDLARARLVMEFNDGSRRDIALKRIGQIISEQKNNHNRN